MKTAPNVLANLTHNTRVKKIATHDRFDALLEALTLEAVMAHLGETDYVRSAQAQADKYWELNNALSDRVTELRALLVRALDPDENEIDFHVDINQALAKEDPKSTTNGGRV